MSVVNENIGSWWGLSTPFRCHWKTGWWEEASCLQGEEVTIHLNGNPARIFYRKGKCWSHISNVLFFVSSIPSSHSCENGEKFVECQWATAGQLRLVLADFPCVIGKCRDIWFLEVEFSFFKLFFLCLDDQMFGNIISFLITRWFLTITVWRAARNEFAADHKAAHNFPPLYPCHLRDPGGMWVTSFPPLWRISLGLD